MRLNVCLMGKEKHVSDNVTCRSCQVQQVECPFPCSGAEPAAKEAVTEQGEKRAKYGNHKIEVAGESFDSKHEYSCCNQLRMMERTGLIRDLKRQVPFELAPAVRLQGRMKPPLRYFADFTYVDCATDTDVVADAKSEITRKDKAFRIKAHLMVSVHGIEIVEM